MANPTDSRLADLEARRQANVGKQVDNASLPALSNMYYYCHICGVHVSTKPEGWYLDPPPKFCPTDKDLINDGVINRTDLYKEWLAANNHPPMPA